MFSLCAKEDKMTTKRLKSYRFLMSSLNTCDDSKRVKSLKKETAEIRSWVHSLDNPLAVRIFEERYIAMENVRDIKLRPWWKVARKLNYSEDHIKHIHSFVINAQK